MDEFLLLAVRHNPVAIAQGHENAAGIGASWTLCELRYSVADLS
jgi:hypothetical protein